eukprot:7252493-Prorocentrum_lima.AAC.1
MEVILGWKVYERDESYGGCWIASPVNRIALRPLTCTAGHDDMGIDVNGEWLFDRLSGTIRGGSLMS